MDWRCGCQVGQYRRNPSYHEWSCLLSTGVTVLPTTLTSFLRVPLVVNLENIGARYQEASGAKIRGIYFEGPYFTEKYKEPQTLPIWKTLYGMVSCLAKAANGLLNKIAPVPEREGVEDFVRTITGEEWLLLLDTPMQLSFDEAAQSMLERVFKVHAYTECVRIPHRELGMVGAMYERHIPMSWFVTVTMWIQRPVTFPCSSKKETSKILPLSQTVWCGNIGDYMLGEFR